MSVKHGNDGKTHRADFVLKRPTGHDALSPELRRSLDDDAIQKLGTGLGMAAALRIQTEEIRATARTALERAYVEELVKQTLEQGAELLAYAKYQTRLRAFVEAEATLLAKDVVLSCRDELEGMVRERVRALFAETVERTVKAELDRALAEVRARFRGQQ